MEVIALMVMVALTQPQIESLKREFTTFARQKGAHGGAMEVIDTRTGTFAEASFGVRDAKQTPFTLDTPCRVASVSKLVTAAACLKLVDEGRLSLDAFALGVLNKDRKEPLVPKDQRMGRITVRQLLQHSGGFDIDKTLLWAFRNRGKTPPTSRQELVDLAFTTETLDFNPGEKWNYSNTGFLALGRIIEKVSGQSYESYVQNAILTPLGVSKESAFIGSRKLRPQETRYWDAPERTAVSLYPDDQGAIVPYPEGSAYAIEEMDSYGGWVFSVRSLARFMIGLPKLLSSQVLAEAVKRPSFGKERSYTGLGFVCIPESQGKVSVFHGGSLEGCNATVMYRANGELIAAVFNTGGMPENNMWAAEVQDRLCEMLNRFAGF